MPRLTAAMLFAVLLLAALPAQADSYQDPDYLAYDLDSQQRAYGRQLAQATDPALAVDFITAGTDAFVGDLGTTVNDLQAGRIYTGGGRYVPGASSGDPRYFYDVSSTPIAFTARTGAKLTGHVWAPIGAPGERPGVVITSGSIQGYEAMYFWAARDLARNGYVVMSWDAQGQGRSEGVGHEPGSIFPTLDGVPFQQDSNFIQGTVDALEFFLSTPDDTYVPPTWTAEEAQLSQDAAEGVEQLDGFNPLFGLLDHSNVGLAGHSLGGTGVGVVQQCSDEGTAHLDLAELCNGRSYPIRAVVGWDGLPTGVVPVVPAMDQGADGYFFNVQPQPEAPDPAANLGAFTTWAEAGIDAYSLTVRGGSHLEWCDIPYVLPATTYGVEMATYYTTAWFDRYLAPEELTNEVALADLMSAPAASDGEPWSGTKMSASRLGAYRLTETTEVMVPGPPPAPGRPHFTRADGPRFQTVEVLHEVDDLRASGGWAAVGDWAAANAE